MNLSYDFIENDKGRKHKLIRISFIILILLLTFSPVILIPNIFYGKIHLWRIIVGILESWIISIFLFSAIFIVVSKDQNIKSDQKQRKWQAFIIALAIAVVFAVLLKIILYPHWRLCIRLSLQYERSKENMQYHALNLILVWYRVGNARKKSICSYERVYALLVMIREPGYFPF